MNPKFYNRPRAREGPRIPYKNESGSNPVLRGYALAILSIIIAYSGFVQRMLWRLNKFDKLKDLPELEDYEPLHDPTVIPIPETATEQLTVKTLPRPRPRKSRQNYYTCADFHELYKSGKVTPSQVVDVLIKALDRDAQPTEKLCLGHIELNEELIREAAKQSTERYKAGQPLSMLDGVPVTVKDEVDLTGYKKRLGSKLDFTDAGDRTAWCVQKWQEAGAVVVGKTNMHEIGMDTTNNNPNYGTPLNPHNDRYYTGGSSGGSAFAVSTGQCPIALGVDGGGSIRLPSAFCGLYGLKPSQGRVSARAGPEFSSSVVVNGPMASSIDDLALAYRIMAQPDPDSRHGSLFPSSLLAPDAARPKAKYIGIYTDWTSRADPDVASLFDAAVHHYVSTQGYKRLDIAIPLLPEAQKAHALTILSETRSRIAPADTAKLSYANQLLLNVAGGHATAQDFLFAQRLRHLLMSHLAFLWDLYPGLLVLTPTAPCAGRKIGQPSDVARGSWGASDGDETLRSMEYVHLANFVGAPAITCPMGYTEKEGLPVGLMAMGEWGCEEQLLAFADEGSGILEGGGPRVAKTGLGDWLDRLCQEA